LKSILLFDIVKVHYNKTSGRWCYRRVGVVNYNWRHQRPLSASSAAGTCI